MRTPARFVADSRAKPAGLWPTAKILRVVLVALVLFGAGAGAAANPLFLGVVAAAIALVASSMYGASNWTFAPLTAVVISPAIFSADGIHAENGDAIQKMVLIFAFVCLAVGLGIKWSTIGALSIGLISFAAMISLFNVGGHIEAPAGTVVRATAGFALPWLFWFVDWAKADLRRVLGFLSSLPLLCLVAGVVLQFLHVTTVISVDATGVTRLQGGSIPAHLAMMALIALVAGLCLLATSGSKSPRLAPIVLVAANLGILLATATRGASAVGLLVVTAFVLYSIVGKRTISRRVRSVGVVIALAGLIVAALAVPELIRRSAGNGYEGKFNTSGRDQAWNFFLGLASESPLTGKGVGFSSVAVDLYIPPQVQRAFYAPHNEYLHLYLDGGVFFALGLIAVFIASIISAVRLQSGMVRLIIGTFGFGTLLYAYVDNTFSTPQFAVLLVVLLASLSAHPDPEVAATARTSIERNRGMTVLRVS